MRPPCEPQTMIVPASAAPIREMLSISTTAKPPISVTVSWRTVLGSEHGASGVAERCTHPETRPLGALVERRDDAVLPGVQGIADHRRIVRDRAGGDPAGLQDGQR